MSYALAFVAGFLCMAGIGFLTERFIGEESYRRYIRKLGARNGWEWLLESCAAGEALAQAAIFRQQVEMLGRSIERVRDLTYSDRLAFGPAFDGASEQYIRIDIAKDDDGLLHPVAVVSGRGPWRFIPLQEATPYAVLEALGPAERAWPGVPWPQIPDIHRVAWIIGKISDSQLRALPGALRTSLVHALLRDAELPGVVEGLVDRHLLAKAAQEKAS